MFSACRGLVDSHFIPTVNDMKWHENGEYGEYHTLDEFYRCFQSVYDYHSGSVEFASKGIQFLRGELGTYTDKSEFKEHMKIVWVRNVMKSTLKAHCNWDMSSTQWLEQYLADYAKMGFVCIPKSKEHKSMLIDNCLHLWTGGTPNNIQVHPEVELLHYLERNNIGAIQSTIGTDSELCFVCGLYFDRVWDRRCWITRPASMNRISNDWGVPLVITQHSSAEYEWLEDCALSTGVEIRRRTAAVVDVYLKRLKEKPKGEEKPVEKVPATGLSGDDHSIASHSKTTTDHPEVKVNPIEKSQPIGSSADTHSLLASSKKTTAEQRKVVAKAVEKRPPIGLSVDNHSLASHTKAKTDQHLK